jgi:flagellar hook-associated protein FlgK
MKKIVSLVIAATFILSLLSACTNASVTQQPLKVTTQNVTSGSTLSLGDALSAISAARAERYEVQLAVHTAMASAGLNTITAHVDNWDGSMNKVKCGSYDAGHYLKTPIKGTYSVSLNGDVTCTSYPGLTPHYLPLINR